MGVLAKENMDKKKGKEKKKKRHADNTRCKLTQVKGKLDQTGHQRVPI